MLSLLDPISKIPFVGNSYIKKFERMGILKVQDLLYHFPYRYEDNSHIYKIADLIEEEARTIIVRVTKTSSARLRGGKTIIKATLTDDESVIDAIWFNQKFIENQLKQDTLYFFTGKLYRGKGKPTLASPKFEIVSDNPTHTARIVPIYALTEGISANWIRARLKYLIELINDNEIDLSETLNKALLERNSLIDIKKAISEIHFPTNFTSLKRARYRFSFEEMFNFLLISKKLNKKESKFKAFKLLAENSELSKFIKKLEFELTDSQIRILAETLSDIREDRPMKKLIQGDTGSGKTVIAIALSLVCSQNGKTAVVLAPTTVLAKQHYNTFQKLLKGLDVRVGLITSKEKIDYKEANIIIGTHAVIKHKKEIENLALLIVDEQHRFGVKQRDELINIYKPKFVKPHYLNMTATPIPRSLALIMWSEFDVTYITDYPKGRQEIETHIVPNLKRRAAYNWIKDEILDKGNQLFVICPLIEESEVLEIKSAKSEFELISKNIFPNYKAELVHGKVKDKNKLLNDFRDKKFQILVSTSVIEVGIDIPDATCIIIEGSERFGLAQLHQLRGRVGRSDKKSYCYLFLSDGFNPQNDNAIKRLEYFCKNNDGLKLAEFDLKSRGPGEVFGTRQSGIPEFRLASMYDKELIMRVRKEIESFEI